MARLDALDAATELRQLNLPGFSAASIEGRAGRTLGVDVSGPWRITFEWSADGDAYRVDLEQYHWAWRVTERPARCPIHPGELLREIIAEGLRLPVAAAARQLGVSRMTLHRVLRGEQAVTPEMAPRLGKLCGNGPELWLRMQMARDLWCLERSMRAELARIPTHSAA